MAEAGLVGTSGHHQGAVAALATLDCYQGNVDAVFGPVTRDAIRRYQEAKGLPQTGRLGVSEATQLPDTGQEGKEAELMAGTIIKSFGTSKTTQKVCIQFRI